MEETTKGYSSEQIELNKKTAILTNKKLNLELAIHSKQMKLGLVSMNLEYGLYSTEADINALQEFFPEVNL